MLWVKHGENTFLITGYNIFKNHESGMCELWITKFHGRNTKLLSFDEKYVMEYKEMFDHAVKTGVHFLEV